MYTRISHVDVADACLAVTQPIQLAFKRNTERNRPTDQARTSYGSTIGTTNVLLVRVIVALCVHARSVSAMDCPQTDHSNGLKQDRSCARRVDRVCCDANNMPDPRPARRVEPPVVVVHRRALDQP